MRYNASSASRNHFVPVIVTGLLVIMLSMIMIAANSGSSGARRGEYTSVVLNEDVSLYDFADSISSDDVNIWEIIYKIKTVNHIDGDNLAADMCLRIPTDIIDASSGSDSIYLCTAD